MRSAILALVVFVSLSLWYPACAEQGWPAFRGPSGDGRDASNTIPATWSETKNVIWKAAIHDRGWSSPVVVEDRIWLSTATPDGKQLFGICLDFDSGDIVHDIKLRDVAEPRTIHKTNSYASPTPLIRGSRVVISFGSYGTFCLDRTTGNELWRRTDLPCNHWRGPGSSPISYEDLVVLHFDGYDYQYVVALNWETGETVWKQDRDIDYGTDDGDIMKAFATPSVFTVDGLDQLVSPTSKATIAYDPSNGVELWRFRYEQFSATARPLFADGVFYLNSGFGKAELFAVRAGGRGDITESHAIWNVKRSIGSKPSALLYDEALFVLHDAGVLSCLDCATGKTLWTERLGGNFSASPILADGKMLFVDEAGRSTVIRPSRDDYRELAVNTLDDGCMASPAVYRDSIVLRTKTHLYRIAEK